MSADGEGTNDQKPPQQQQQQLNAQDLNFSLNDILNHDVNDSSFQSIVQTLSNTNEHITPSYAHLPAELQDLFSNETDDLLSTQDSHSDALLHDMWQPPFVNKPEPPSSTTLLDNITSKLPPERKDRFIQLFRELQSSNVSAEHFLHQAKSLLGEQQYQQLEDLKNKPIQKRSSQIRAEDAQRSMPSHTPQLKRPKTEHIPSLQQQPMQFPPTMQQQQQQMQHLQLSLQQQHMQMLQQQQQQQQQQPVIPVTPQPVFKTPAVPIAGLQIPTKTTQITSKPATTSTPTTSSSGGGGDSRIDYEALTDVMGYTGVDLKEESELFMSNTDTLGGTLPDGIDLSKVQDFMNVDMLKTRILKYAKCVDIKEIDGDFVSYLALAAQDRIRTVMESMVLASKHRTWSPFKKPPISDGHAMYKIQVKQQVKLQLEAIQRVSRQTELDLDPEEEEEEKEVMSHDKGWYSNTSRKPMTSIEEKRKITVQDAIFVLERDVQGGRGSNQKALLRAYNEYLT